MKPREVAKVIDKHLNDDSIKTQKGIRVKSIFKALSDENKKVFANNVNRAWNEYKEESQSRELKMLQQKAKVLGFELIQKK